jgi:hypothetical protein
MDRLSGVAASTRGRELAGRVGASRDASMPARSQAFVFYNYEDAMRQEELNPPAIVKTAISLDTAGKSSGKHQKTRRF